MNLAVDYFPFLNVGQFLFMKFFFQVFWSNLYFDLIIFLFGCWCSYSWSFFPWFIVKFNCWFDHHPFLNIGELLVLVFFFMKFFLLVQFLLLIWSLPFLGVGALIHECHNPNLGLATKARGCKVAGEERSLRFMVHAFGSAKECEGIDLHTPKGTPILEVGVLVDSKCSKSACKGQNPMDWRIFYIIRKLLKFICLKWDCMTHLNI